MKVYGLIVGGYADINHPNDRKVLRMCLHYPNYPLSQNKHKNYGLYRFSNISNSYNTSDIMDGGRIYVFPYHDLLNFLKRKLDSEMLDDPSIMEIGSDQINNYLLDYAGREFFQYTVIDGKLNKCITSLYKESIHIDNINYNVDANTVMHIKTSNGRKIPLWAVCIDIEFAEPDMDYYIQQCGYKGEHPLRPRISHMDICDMSDVSIVLNMIKDQMDEEEEMDSNSISKELERLSYIADCYDSEDEF